MKKNYIYLVILAVGIVIGYALFSFQNQLNLGKRSTVTDPLGLFGKQNIDLENCLKNNNPSDPLGLNGETQQQKTLREACISRYSN